MVGAQWDMFDAHTDRIATVSTEVLGRKSRSSPGCGGAFGAAAPR